LPISVYCMIYALYRQASLPMGKMGFTPKGGQ
jgi:hypothetical protein